MSIIISKLGKLAYNNLKAFCPIILLNVLEKLIEKSLSQTLFQLPNKYLICSFTLTNSTPLSYLAI